MLPFFDELLDDELVTVQDEPALEMAMPQVFTQPALTMLQRGKLPAVEALIAKLYRTRVGTNGTTSLGPDYQLVVNEFQPLFTWAIASWDFLLSTEGCRFIPRGGEEKLCSRGDYRAVTDTDFSRLVHRVFRCCVLEFARLELSSFDGLRTTLSKGLRAEAVARVEGSQSFSSYLRTHFWGEVVRAYQQLEYPPDPHQRTLTAYSYLRCCPYQFLNSFHHELVHHTLQKLPPAEVQAIDRYFLNFYTLDATAEALALSCDASETLLQRGLLTLLLNDRLVYCLLRQIERY